MYIFFKVVQDLCIKSPHFIVFSSCQVLALWVCAHYGLWWSANVRVKPLLSQSYISSVFMEALIFSVGPISWRRWREQTHLTLTVQVSAQGQQMRLLQTAEGRVGDLVGQRRGHPGQWSTLGEAAMGRLLFVSCAAVLKPDLENLTHDVIIWQACVYVCVWVSETWDRWPRGGAVTFSAALTV